MTPKEWLVDLADAAADLGLSIRRIEPSSIELYGDGETSITITSHFLSGRMLRSILRPRPDPAAAPENSSPTRITNPIAPIP